jgi:hypothetical protein
MEETKTNTSTGMPTKTSGTKNGNDEIEENHEFLIPSEELKCSP